jgi:hypothetical protein
MLAFWNYCHWNMAGVVGDVAGLLWPRKSLWEYSYHKVLRPPSDQALWWPEGSLTAGLKILSVFWLLVEGLWQIWGSKKALLK